jgi:hypothetical protein
MFSRYFRSLTTELVLVRPISAVRKLHRMTVGGGIGGSTVTSFLKAIGFAALLGAALAAPALAQNYADELTPTPDIEKVGGRYILMVLDQPDRDLVHGRTKVNMLVDTKTGKTWLLEYSRKPNSNEMGYVWSEVPFATVPGE